MKKYLNHIVIVSIISIMSATLSNATIITGTVTDKATGLAVRDALVGIASDSAQAVTDSSGKFILSTGTAVRRNLSWKRDSNVPYITGNKIHFTTSGNEIVQIERFGLDGKRQFSTSPAVYKQGSHTADIGAKVKETSGVSIINVSIGNNKYTFQDINPGNGVRKPAGIYNTTGLASNSAALTTEPDSLIVSRFGYKTIRHALGDSVSNLSVSLDTEKLFVFVEGGAFLQGNSDTATDANQRPVHSVTVSGFYVDKYPVTFNDYDAYSLSTGAKKAVDKKKYGRGSTPVRGITWFDAILYANWQSLRDGLTPVYKIDSLTADTNNVDTTTGAKKWTVSADWTVNGYRLLTEAEWEYAARGGKYTHGYKFSGSDSLRAVAWTGYDTLSDGSYLGAKPVGTKLPNELGLYDFSGNAHQYVWDKALSSTKGVNYPSEALTDPRGPEGKYDRVVVRGAGFMAKEKCNLVTSRKFKKLNAIDYPGIRLGRTK